MFMSNKPMTIEKWCEEVEEVLADETWLGVWGTDTIYKALQIIRRQQAALKNLKTHMEVVTGPSYWSSSAWRIASESLADCDAIVSGEGK